MTKLGFSGAAIAILLAASAAQADTQAKPASADQRREMRAGFEEGIMRSPGAPLFHSLKRNFPAEYEPFLDRMFTEVLAAGGSEADAHRVGFEGMRRFFIQKLGDVVNAPAEKLIALNAAQLALVKTLAVEDRALCAEYVSTGFRAGTRLPAAAERGSVEVSLRMIEAAAAGARAPRDGSRGHVAEKAAAAFVAEVLKIDPSLQPLLVDEAAHAKAPPERICAFGDAIYTAIGKLPVGTGADISAFLLLQGAAQR